MVTNAEASREIRRLFWEQWVPAMTTINLQKRLGGSYMPVVRWDNVEVNDFNDNGVHWCHFRLRNLETRQRSLTGGRVQEIGTMYTTRGLVLIDLYFSKSSYKTNDKDAVEEAVQSIFFKQTTPGGVWFRKPTIRQLEPTESHFRSLVTAEYTFDTCID